MVLATVSWVPSAHAQTIPNPSFEEGWNNYNATSDVGYASEIPGGIPGWTLSNAGRIGWNPILTGSLFANNGTIPNGNRVLFLQSTGTRVEASTVISGLTPGAPYALSFRSNVRQGFGFAQPFWSVNKQPFVGFVGGPAVGGSNPYRSVSSVFIATNDSAPLVLANHTTGDSCVLVDDFRISPTPPARWHASPWRGDADTGLSPEKTRWAYHFNSTTTASVNGVAVPGLPGATSAVAGKFSLSGNVYTFNDFSNRLTDQGGSGSAIIARSFVFGGSPATVTLEGLQTGQSYRLTIFGVGFEGRGSRIATFSDSFSAEAVMDENDYGFQNGIRVDYCFTATAATRTLTIQPRSPDSTYHLFGIALSVSPVSIDLPVANVSRGAATLSGTVNPEASSTSAWFEYAPEDQPFGQRTPPTLLPISGVFEPIRASLSALTPGIVYRCRVVSSNSAGVNLGSEVFLRQPNAEPVTLPPSILCDGAAQLNGTITPEGYETTVWFEWGTKAAPGTKTTPVSLVSGDPVVMLSASIEGLIPGIEYVHRLASSNRYGVFRGQPVAFSVQPGSVTTAGSAGLIDSAARLDAVVSTGNLPIRAWFEWGTETNEFPNHTTPMTIESGVQSYPLSAVISSLSPEEHYYARAVVSNQCQVLRGNVIDFRSVQTNWVRNTDDNGPGSLRQTVAESREGDAIQFDSSLSGKTISFSAYPGQILCSRSISIDGSTLPKGLTLSGSETTRLFTISEGARVTLRGLTLTRGFESHQRTIYIIDGIPYEGPIAYGATAKGGAIYNAGNLTLDRCTLFQNRAVGVVGASGKVPSPGGDGRGGAIFNAGSLVLNQCTITENTAAGGDGGSYGELNGNAKTGTGGNGYGGGIFNSGALEVNQCTIALNSTFAGVGGRTSLLFPSLAASGLRGAAGIASETAATTLFHSIVALNDPSNVALHPDSSLIAPNLIDTDPKLEPLGDYGGPTWTLPLNAASPAVDAAGMEAASAPYDFKTDQRGFPRLKGAQIDLGAVELVLTPRGPTLSGLAHAVVGTNLVNGNRWVELTGSVDPHWRLSYATFEYGLTTAYAATNGPFIVGVITTPDSATPRLSTTVELAPGQTFHWRMMVTNALGKTVSLDQTLRLDPAAGAGSPADLNGDGLVDAKDLKVVLEGLNGNGILTPSDLRLVLSNYWPNSLFLGMTNTAGLGGDTVTFELNEAGTGALDIEYSTNLIDWQKLGPAQPLYKFSDTNAPSTPRRFYRLSAP